MSTNSPEAPSGASEASPASKIDANALRSKARRGIVALVAQTIFMRGGMFAAGILLARLLDPADFGLFTIVQTALAFFTFLGDCGVGGALVRQKHEPTKEELSTVFYFQIAVASVIVAAVWVVSSRLHLIWPDFPDRAVWIIRALAVDVLLTVLRVIPSILLERRLAYGRIAILEAIVRISFMATALGGAALGLHTWALAIGVLVQGSVSVIGAQLLQPFWPSLTYDGAKLKPILKFGLTYQAKNVIGFVNGMVTPLYGGHALGAQRLGYVNFARDKAWDPLTLVEIIGRVNFPLYARLQGDPKLFSETLGRSIQICGMATMATVGFFLGMGPSFIHIVYGEKWLPALPMFYAFAIAISFGFLSPIVGAALDASGRPGVLARLAIGWTLLNWVAVFIATPRWGMMGFTIGFCTHVIVGNLGVVWMLKKLIPDAVIWPRLRASILAGFGAAGAGRLLDGWVGAPSPSWLSAIKLVLGLVGCIGVFAGLLLAVDRTALAELRTWNETRKKPAAPSIA
jgi:PST family polysaccharide transporter